MKKRLVILGSTGSIGMQTLDVIALHPDKFEVAAISARSSIKILKEQAERFNPEMIAITDIDAGRAFKDSYSGSAKIEIGEDAIIKAVSLDDVDIVLSGVVGAVGLRAAMTTLTLGRTLALANKETLVAGGQIVMDAAVKYGAEIIPVDSEHSAIFQCLEGSKNPVKRILLTASGGPFRGKTKTELENISVEDALRHPSWSMGPKITVDSASLMNKGLEVIEAKWLFDIEPDKIEVVVHPQSIIHSMVEFDDGSVLAQMGNPDMKVPILYALSRPDRFDTGTKPLNLADIGSLTFEKPDMETFKCLGLAYKALAAGGTMPAALNSANEAAVDLFLKGKIGFNNIPDMIIKGMEGHSYKEEPSLYDIEMIDKEVRDIVMLNSFH